jgi:hypothetical protein
MLETRYVVGFRGSPPAIIQSNYESIFNARRPESYTEMSR